MRSPSRFHTDLWRRLAEAQDQAAATGDTESAQRDLAREISERTALQAPNRSRSRGALLALAGATALLVGGAVALLRPRYQPVAARPGLVDQHLVGTSFVADARSDLPLRFGDGSTVVFRAGSSGRMQRLTGSGADIVLEHGRLEAHVIHADTTLWLVHAGPYRVRVTGTRFALDWAAGIFEVDLYEGAVIVDGAVLGAGVPLGAGQRLKVSRDVVLIDGLPIAVSPALASPALASTARDNAAQPAESPGTGPASPAAAEISGAMVGRSAVDWRVGAPSKATKDSDVFLRSLSSNERWLTLAERGEYRGALIEAKRLGWGGLCRRLDARRLLTLGDVARYSGARVPARQAFQALVNRFPHDRLAADAVFSLGRLAFESSHPDEAMRWFRRYVAEWPAAPLGDQAAGRLLECAIRVDDRPAARDAARRYLARAPSGPHATLAREVLDEPVDGPP